MPRRTSKKRKTNSPASRGEGLLFVEQNSSHFRRENLRAIVSHARKTQTQQKHERRRASAMSESHYARSLVGWQLDTSVATRDKPVVPLPHASNLDALLTPSETFVPGAGMVQDRIDPPISGGLRSDPFASFPIENSREAMEMIDFCEWPADLSGTMLMRVIQTCRSTPSIRRQSLRIASMPTLSWIFV